MSSLKKQSVRTGLWGTRQKSGIESSADERQLFVSSSLLCEKSCGDFSFEDSTKKTR